MNQIKENIINFFKSLFSIFRRDLILQYRNISELSALVIFFFIMMTIFIFAVGPEDEQIKIVGIPILWSILIFSTSFVLNKSLKEDFDDGNFAIYKIAGFSLELIALLKILTSWILYQLPLLIIMPFFCILLEIPQQKIYLLMITMVIGSPILTILTLISSSMLLTNNKNLSLGSLIILPLCIPVIIFSVGSINADKELFEPQMYILSAILLLALALGPWLISGCIKIAIKN